MDGNVRHEGRDYKENSPTPAKHRFSMANSESGIARLCVQATENPSVPRQNPDARLWAPNQVMTRQQAGGFTPPML
jgi:hypothetical protein